jgi:hypothetical protein
MSETTTTLVKTEAELGDHSFRIKRSAPKRSAQLLGSTGSHLTPSRRCPVCFRTPCPLNSHKQYARSRGLVGARTSADTRESSSSLSRSSSEAASERSDGRLHARLVQIGATDIDSFIHFPLPKGVKADVHQLFRDCKPTTFSFVTFSLHSVANDPFQMTMAHEMHPMRYRLTSMKSSPCIRQSLPPDQRLDHHP